MAPLVEALEFAQAAKLDAELISAVRQAASAKEAPGTKAWCFSDAPPGLLVAQSRKDVTRFNGSMNWARVLLGTTDSYGAATDGSIRIVQLGGNLYKGLRPASASQQFARTLGLRENPALTAMCSQPENAHWTERDQVLQVVDSSPRGNDARDPDGGRSIAERIAQLNSLHEQGLISVQQRDERIQTILNEV